MTKSVACILVVVLLAAPAAARSGERRADQRTIDLIIKRLCRDVDEDTPEDLRQERRSKLVALGEKGRVALMEIAVSKEYGDAARECAVYHLGSLGEKRAIPLIRDIAKDVSVTESVRRAAVFVLNCRLEDPDALEMTMDLIRGKDEAIYGAALDALTHYNNPRVRAFVRDILARGNYPPRGYLYSLLTVVGTYWRDAEAIPLLKELARERKPPGDTVAIANALTRIGTEESRTAAKDVCVSMEDVPYWPAGHWKIACAESMLGL